MIRRLRFLFAILPGFAAYCSGLSAEELPVIATEGQPLGANVTRVVQALDLLGRPLPEELTTKLAEAAKARDAERLQKLLDPQVLLLVALNPESRVKVSRGPAEAVLQKAGYTPVLVKIINESTVTKRLSILSPQAGPVYAGAFPGSVGVRQQQPELAENQNEKGATDRFLAVEMFDKPPLTANLSGLEVEYAIALIYCHESGKREATIGFDVAQGNQDLGFRGETPILFDVKPAVKVTIVADEGDIVKLLFKDEHGHVYPPQAKRLAPDFFFQPHVYRASGESVLLPPGKFTVSYSRGPEFKIVRQELTATQREPGTSMVLDIDLARWVDPGKYGFYSGDHHIHAAGCAHYTSPTEGVLPEHMFRQVKGEGLNVGCVLTWGPCYRYQRQFFEPKPHDLSDEETILKYDLEISGFGSQALGHVCLLNLKDQTYPGSDGTETKGWPSWTTPVMKWCKDQGGVTGYAHSASGIQIDPPAAAARMLARYDADKDKQLSRDEVKDALLTEPFQQTDADRDGLVSLMELTAAHDRAADQLPNLAIPEMNGVGAMELAVSVSEGVCDFISAMDTERIQEWNSWYHVLNCGYPLKVSGETDFPCMSSRHVGQGRVYVRLGAGLPTPPARNDRRSPALRGQGDLRSKGSAGSGDTRRTLKFTYENWCRGIAEGRSYVSDGYAHPLVFEVNGIAPGDGDVKLPAAGKVRIQAKVAFAEETPLAVAYGTLTSAQGQRIIGDTRILHGPRRDEEMLVGGDRLVELVVNGIPVASHRVPADGKEHDLALEVPIDKSSWVALRHFPQFHTNPVNVLVASKPIRASRQSARWCQEVIEQLWNNRQKNIVPPERDAAQAAFERAKERYRQIAAEAANN
jgi:hypothetical protein